MKRNHEDAARALNSLRTLIRALGASTRRAAIFGGISGAQMFALRQIHDSPGMQIGELSRRTLAGQSSVSEVVARLVDAGLVIRTSDGHDARQVNLDLTARGKRIARDSSITAQERLVTGLAILSGRRRAALADALEALISAAGFESVAPAMFFEKPKPPKRRSK